MQFRSIMILSSLVFACKSTGSAPRIPDAKPKSGMPGPIMESTEGAPNPMPQAGIPAGNQPMESNSMPAKPMETPAAQLPPQESKPVQSTPISEGAGVGVATSLSGVYYGCLVTGMTSTAYSFHINLEGKWATLVTQKWNSPDCSQFNNDTFTAALGNPLFSAELKLGEASSRTLTITEQTVKKDTLKFVLVEGTAKLTYLFTVGPERLTQTEYCDGTFGCQARNMVLRRLGGRYLTCIPDGGKSQEREYIMDAKGASVLFRYKDFAGASDCKGASTVSYEKTGLIQGIVSSGDKLKLFYTIDGSEWRTHGSFIQDELKLEFECLKSFCYATSLQFVKTAVSIPP